MTQESSLAGNNIKYGARNAVDGNFGTQAGAHTWLKLEFGKEYSILRVIYYYKYYTGWNYEKSECYKSAEKFVEECVYNDSGVWVTVYMGDKEVHYCGAVNLRIGLSKSDQTYEILCNGAVGDNLKLEEGRSGLVITVFELEVYSSW